jgi:hypothetical protein
LNCLFRKLNPRARFDRAGETMNRGLASLIYRRSGRGKLHQMLGLPAR